jgi:hypothetical protein
MSFTKMGIVLVVGLGFCFLINNKAAALTCPKGQVEE